MTVSMEAKSRLSVAERMVLAGRIWDSIPEESDDLTISPADERELDRRLDRFGAGKSRTVTWAELKRTLRARREQGLATQRRTVASGMNVVTSRATRREKRHIPPVALEHGGAVT